MSLAFSIRGLEMGILAPVTGAFVDRLGPRKLVFLGTLITGSALIILSLTNSLLIFYGAFVLLAVGASCCTSTVLMTAVAHWFRKNVGKAMGLVACGFGAGGILVPLIVWLIDVYHWRMAFVVLGLGMWTLGIPLSFVIRHRPEQYGYSPDGEIPGELNSSPGDGCAEEGVYFREAIGNQDFWKISVAEAIRISVTMAVVTHVLPYLTNIGMSRGSAALVATAIPLLSIVGRFSFGWLGDVFEKRYVAAVGYGLFSMGTLAFSWVHVPWFILPFLALFPLAFGGTVALRGAILREYFGRTAFGRLMGIMLGLGAMGGFIGPTAAGWTFDNLGRYQPVWLVFGGTSVLATALALRLRAPVRVTQGQESA